ncbi:putative LRR receptor-like serine/threonine-protein kinase [Canna indica]|uniref:non-specific serine/threonine protein kinase n=1 Tax=Canna indica TaxID=4628 RepID=A0AAQ3KNN3_9LILI|nr:putative LRR receptor-like serine/threonine-protein kinase [Canna indica]
MAVPHCHCPPSLAFLLVHGISISILLASADPPGFLSLSCGGSTSFVDSYNISWVPDAPYVAAGNATAANFVQAGSMSHLPLRFFPDSGAESRACYRLPVGDVSAVLIRTRFVYGNHDGMLRPPVFTVSLGRAIAGFVNLSQVDPWVEEFVWRVDRDILPFCLHSIVGGGFPVISSLEVRPLPKGSYGTTMAKFGGNLLRKRFRINCGYVDEEPLRYPVDKYDRLWDADERFSPSHLAASFHFPISFDPTGIKENPPISILQTARVLARKNVLTYSFPLYKLGDYSVILYFAGIVPVSSSFDVLINGDVIHSNYTVKHEEVSSIFFLKKRIDSLNITLHNISFYPQVNGIEIYEILGIPMECSTTTVSALQVIRQSTGFDFGWEDDPCSPKPWMHVGCDGNLVTSLKLSNIDLGAITPTFGDLLDLKILDLHNASIAGEITNLGTLQKLEILNLSFNKLTSFGSDFNDMISLQILDLHNNSLEGEVPDGLGSLNKLRLLNLENNKLRGVLPQSLNKESLEVRTSGNLCLSFSSTCNNLSDHSSIPTPQVVFDMKRPSSHPNYRTVIIVAVATGGICFAILLILVALMVQRRRSKGDDVTSRTSREIQRWNVARIFSYKEIKSITNNFKDVIGTGGFGSVYLGKLSDGKLVAVKVRLDRTQLGADSFMNEVQLLSQVRHQNLVTLEGFCHESKQQILVYEYLAGGSLADNLYGSNSKRATLNWARRLKIAVDAAKGLDYLHNGSNPRIIHRDVKCSNILLDSEVNAKVSDFGLSKQVLQVDATHVTTAVKGTAGYLDPEYYATQQLTEKSDIYSFGVVLLEMICGREPLSHAGTPDSYNLVLWAKPYLQAGSFDIVDESLRGGFNKESMAKAASTAVRCVERDASRRPTIAEVLAELKEAYSTQLTSLSTQGHDDV